MTSLYSDSVESAFRTIVNARSDLRLRVFETQAVDAFVFGERAGVDKVEIVDRLDALGAEFGWSPDERQKLIAAAIGKSESENKTEGESQAQGAPTFEEADRGRAGGGSEDEPGPPEFSDEALALLFAECHDDLRYVAKLGRWFVWDGMAWREDDTLLGRDRARRTCRAAAARCGEQQSRLARAIASAKTVAGVERLAQSDRTLAATVDQFDRDIFALNTPAGIIDLRSGQMRPHDRAAYLTKITGVAPDFDTPTPVWDAFLRKIMGGHDEVIEYLRRVAGYSLTGSTQEHALFFCYGVGANGKSTFLNAITAAAGDYHRTAPIETFISSNHDRHPTELAGLRGARVVTAIETEEGRRWAESRIKSLTGGDPIPARFMRQDFFEYTPQFKLIIAGNHKPGLRSVDEAIRRRFNLIPFSVTIPSGERDETLPDRLKVEGPGILAWAITGCIDWQRRGLAAPKIVTDATAAYLDSEDAVSAWLDDMAERDGGSFATTAHLFGSWSNWAEKAGEYVGSAKRFGQALEKRGFVHHRHRQIGRGFLGIRLKDGPSDATQF
jgi:putative DNA primase/helicase